MTGRPGDGGGVTPEDVLPTYRRVAGAFARGRAGDLHERPALDALLRLAPGPRVLDLGCGTGVPVARYLADHGARITGVDGAGPMLRLFRRNLPGHAALARDMRGLRLGTRFDAIIAWNSLFHLSATAQRPMFATVARHAAPGAAFLFTSGPVAGRRIGHAAGGAAVFHESLDPAEYRHLLRAAGFEVVCFRPEDPEVREHSWWLARRRPDASTPRARGPAFAIGDPAP